MKNAVQSLKLILHKNEDWLLGALLGTNNDANLFCDGNSQNNLRGKDCLYAFITEKDIQAKLASELSQADRCCHVHVEVPIYRTKNRRGRRRRETDNFRPDILLLSTRRREKRVILKEKNLEVAAVEIKYFKKYHKPWLAEMIENDVVKLSTYLKLRVEPKVDNGYFVCVDESGEAENHLKKLFAKQWVRDKKIGYLVVAPKYYPMELEKYGQGWERSSAYVMDKALRMVKSEFQSMTRERLKWDRAGEYKRSAGPWFNIHCKRKRKPIGWAEFDWHFRDGRRIKPALIVELYDENQHVGNRKSVEWNRKLERFENFQNHSTIRVYHKCKRTDSHDLNKMNLTADQIYHAVKRILRKAERR